MSMNPYKLAGLSSYKMGATEFANMPQNEFLELFKPIPKTIQTLTKSIQKKRALQTEWIGEHRVELLMLNTIS